MRWKKAGEGSCEAAVRQFKSARPDHSKSSENQRFFGRSRKQRERACSEVAMLYLTAWQSPRRTPAASLLTQQPIVGGFAQDPLILREMHGEICLSQLSLRTQARRPWSLKSMHCGPTIGWARQAQSSRPPLSNEPFGTRYNADRDRMRGEARTLYLYLS